MYFIKKHKAERTMSNKPPFIANLIIRLFSRFDEEFDLIRTLSDIYKERLMDHGRLNADIWYWKQVLHSLLRNRIFNIIWSMKMLKNYLKIAFRNIKRYKTYSIVNLTGLSLGIASSLLILAYVNFEFSFDEYHGNKDRIYRFAATGTQGINHYSIASVHSSVKDYLELNFPEVEDIVRFAKPWLETFSNGDKKFKEDGLYYADNSVFNIFDLELLSGDPNNALTLPYTVVLSAELAEKYFGDENPLGKIIKCDDEYEFTITGIMVKPPVNSHLQYDALISMESMKKIFEHPFEYRGHFDWFTYILMREDHNIDEFESKLSGFFDQQYSDVLVSTGRNLSVLIQPLTSIHLYSNLTYDNPGNTNITYIYGLITSAVFILLIAIFNYVNLSTVRWTKRTKEIGMRKVLGAFKEQLILQCFGESALNTLIAFIIGIILVVLTFPYLYFISGYNLDIGFLTTRSLILQALMILGIISFTASVYTAFFVSGFRPIKIIKGINTGGKNISFSRNALVVLQFLISISLIIVTIGVFGQIDFLKQTGLGFNDKQLIYSPVYTDYMGDLGNEKVDIWISSIKQELLLLEGVEEVSFTTTLPGGYYALSKLNPEGLSEQKTINAVLYDVSDDYLKTLEIEIIEGRRFTKEFPADRDNSVIINETAAKMIGWEEPIGKKIKTENGDKSWTVVGIMKDIHCRSLHHKIDPLVITNFPHSHYMMLRIKSENFENTLAGIESIWDRMEPNHPFEYSFLEDRISSMYNSEEKAGKIVQIFAILAIIISSLGIFGFVSYMIEQRTKEIGIRKTFGATEMSIACIFVKNLAVWIVIASVFAIPIGYFIVNRWLESYAYRINVGWEIFLLSGLSAFMLALVTILFQTIKAACAKPVETLRYE